MVVLYRCLKQKSTQKLGINLIVYILLGDVKKPKRKTPKESKKGKQRKILEVTKYIQCIIRNIILNNYEQQAKQQAKKTTRTNKRKQTNKKT